MSTLTTDEMTDRPATQAETVEALRGSIAKWQDIVDGTGIDDGCENCPLCQTFNREFLGTDIDAPDEDYDGPWNCLGCPVATATGRDFCAGSPYGTYCANGRLKSDATKELDFLKSLLPPGVES